MEWMTVELKFLLPFYRLWYKLRRPKPVPVERLIPHREGRTEAMTAVLRRLHEQRAMQTVIPGTECSTVLDHTFFRTLHTDTMRIQMKDSCITEEEMADRSDVAGQRKGSGWPKGA